MCGLTSSPIIAACQAQVIDGATRATYEIKVDSRYQVTRAWEVDKTVDPSEQYQPLDIPLGGNASAQFTITTKATDLVATASIKIAASLQICTTRGERPYYFSNTATWTLTNLTTTLASQQLTVGATNLEVQVPQGGCSPIWRFPVQFNLTSVPTGPLHLRVVLTPVPGLAPSSVPPINTTFSFANSPAIAPEPMEVTGTAGCALT